MDVQTTGEIPKKSSFKSEELCRLTGIRPYVLRFWESEFSEISPILSDSGQKIYEQKDIELIVLIKKWIFGEKLTIEQVKKKLFDRDKGQASKPPQEKKVEKVEKIVAQQNNVKSSKSVFLQLKKELQKVQLTLEAIQKRHNWM